MMRRTCAPFDTAPSQVMNVIAAELNFSCSEGNITRKGWRVATCKSWVETKLLRPKSRTSYASFTSPPACSRNASYNRAGPSSTSFSPSRTTSDSNACVLIVV